MAPGSPWENGYAESFHSRLRDEFLARELFESLAAARRLTAAWREDYNHQRPHSSLGLPDPLRVRVGVCGCENFATLSPQPHTPEKPTLPITQPIPS